MKPFVTTAIVIGVVVVFIVIYLCFSYRFNYLFKSWYILLQNKYVVFPFIWDVLIPRIWSLLKMLSIVSTSEISETSICWNWVSNAESIWL